MKYDLTHSRPSAAIAVRRREGDWRWRRHI
jgi:hypothetical protein